MNADSTTVWLAVNAACFAMIAATWYAHRQFPHRIDRSALVFRSSLWLLFALGSSLSITLG